MRRIAALPRRVAPPVGAEALSQALRRPGSTAELRPIQAWALAEILTCGGLLAPIRVGAGKTLITYLAGAMLGMTKALLLVPAKLRDKTQRDFDALSQEWRTIGAPLVVSYEILGRVEHAGDLEDLAPDLIIADEAHRLKNPRAAVTRRVGRYMDLHPECSFVALSGTMTARSLADFAHIAEWCLGQSAPVPLTRIDLEQWCQALDEDRQWADCRMAPGALLELGDGDTARDVYRRRLTETPGVVASSGRGVACSLEISRWGSDISRSDELAEAVARLEDLWELPDGTPLVSAADVWRHARELALGFWYRWNPSPPDEWLDARREWAAFARNILSRSRTLDSEAQVVDAYPDEAGEWLKIRDTFRPRTVAEWIDTNVIAMAGMWAKNVDGIVWVEHSTALAEMFPTMGVQYFGQMGKNKHGVMIEDAPLGMGIAASIAANLEGRNLQARHRNLILSTPTTGDRWEQLLGRTHRDGQQADTVRAEVFLGCKQDEAGFWGAVSDARYQKGVLGSPQKLLLADISFAENTKG